MSVGQIPKKAKLSNLINFRVRVTTLDTSQFTGTLLSFDSHLNLVLSETEEFRVTKNSLKELRKQSKNSKLVDESVIKEEKRLLGLVILRGETVVSVVVEAKPNIATLKPELRLNKGKGSIKPLKTLDNASGTKKSTASGSLNAPIKTIAPAGVTKPGRAQPSSGFRRR